MPAVHLLTKDMWLKQGEGWTLITYIPIAAYNLQQVGRLQAVQEAQKLAKEDMEKYGQADIEEETDDRGFTISVTSGTRRNSYRVRRVKEGRTRPMSPLA